MRHPIWCVTALAVCAAVVYPANPVAAQTEETAAELEALRLEVDELKQKAAEEELEELRQAADAASREAEAPEELGSKTFHGGERSLQALNPELSVVGDVFGQFVFQDGEVYSESARTAFVPRVLGLHFQSNLDPFSFTKLAIEVEPEGVELGEGYITWTHVAPWVSITMGKFRQQFGVVNRWHKHGLDQLDFPLMLREHFGPGGLNQVGVSALLFVPPLWSDALELELQITNGMNPKVFSGDFFSIPSGLLHVRNYWDLNRNTYLELGLTGLVGLNNGWGKPVESEESVALYDDNGDPVTFYDAAGNPVTVVGRQETAVVNEDRRLTVVGGADLTLNWEPRSRAKYAGFTWRTEFLWAYKEVINPRGREAVINSWGLYSYVDWKFMRNWIVGVRGDLTEPFELTSVRNQMPGKYTWGVVPYLTWWQSPWVRFRLQYSYTDWAAGEPEHRGVLQVTFAAGPHKHERY